MKSCSFPFPSVLAVCKNSVSRNLFTILNDAYLLQKKFECWIQNYHFQYGFIHSFWLFAYRVISEIHYKMRQYTWDRNILVETKNLKQLTIILCCTWQWIDKLCTKSKKYEIYVDLWQSSAAIFFLAYLYSSKVMASCPLVLPLILISFQTTSI